MALLFARSSDVWTWQPEGWRYPTPRAAYQVLWEEINGKDSWSANPWICALTFEATTANVGTVTPEQKDAAA